MNISDIIWSVNKSKYYKTCSKVVRTWTVENFELFPYWHFKVIPYLSYSTVALHWAVLFWPPPPPPFPYSIAGSFNSSLPRDRMALPAILDSWQPGSSWIVATRLVNSEDQYQKKTNHILFHLVWSLSSWIYNIAFLKNVCTTVGRRKRLKRSV